MSMTVMKNSSPASKFYEKVKVELYYLMVTSLSNDVTVSLQTILRALSYTLFVLLLICLP